MTSGRISIGAGSEFDVDSGEFDWSGGDFTGQGSIVVDGIPDAGVQDPTLIIMQNARNLGVNLVVGTTASNPPATAILQELNQDLNVGANCGIQVASNGILTFAQTSGNVVCSTGATSTTSVISNGGTFNFNTSATIKCDLPLVNGGPATVSNVMGGTLEFTNGAKGTGFSVSQSDGVINIYAGAHLTADANTNINGGTLETIGAGTAQLSGILTVQAG